MPVENRPCEDAMSRVILREQDEYEFTYKLGAQIGHLNYAGHIGHDAIIAMVWEARVHLFRALGLTELDLGDNETGIIMTDLGINFKEEAFLFEEVTVESHVGEVGERRFRLFHRISKTGRLVALLETGFSTYNYNLRRAVPVPQTFLNALRAYKPKNLPAARTPG
jgi:acyl-CoA thioester hydrolase